MYVDEVEYGIQPRIERIHSAQKEKAITRFKTEISEQKHGFINMLKLGELVEQCEAMIDKIAWAETLVVIGIGGSDLGSRAIQDALQGFNPPMKVIFTGDTTDPTEIDRLQRELNLHTTIFNVVSKSGGTIETISNYLYWKNEMRKAADNWADHFIFSTDPESGLLFQEAQEFDIEILPIPNDVGGRFSVLSPVGLFPALAMGIEAGDLVDGANSVLMDFIRNTEESIACQIAWEQFTLLQQGIPTVVMMPYSTKLNEFARWFRQLWAESLGEAGRGVLPIQSYGPADQHSQLQFYVEGPVIASCLFLKVLDHQSSQKIESVDIEEFSYLEGKTFEEIINAELYATASSLQKIGRPSATLEIEKVDAANLGELFMTFELAVVLLGYMLDMNPFDQPGVEESKRLIKQKLQTINSN